MIFDVVISTDAKEDIKAYAAHLSEVEPEFRETWLARIRETLESLAEFPYRGKLYGKAKRLDSEFRYIILHSHRIFYVVESNAVHVTSIIHMSQGELSEIRRLKNAEATLRFDKTITLIDEANSADPNTDTLDGVEGPKELIYGKRMMDWVTRLNPEASDELKIAARAQHIFRWEVPRSDYPEGKAGYYQWRTYLYGYHAEKAGALMREAGYPEESIERVRVIMDKKNLRKDPDTQTLEDAAGLVFLENHLAEFAERDDMDNEKTIDILRKTWGKMSQTGHDAALNLVLPKESAALVEKALNG